MDKICFEEAEKLIPAQIKKIRSVLEEKYHLVIPADCNKFVARCLRMKDGNVENAIRLIRGFYSTIINFRNWEAAFTPSLFQHFYKTGIAEPLINGDKHGRFILIIRGGLWDTQKISFDQVVAMLWMMVNYGHAEFLHVQRNGYVIIFDFLDFTWQHIWAIKQLKLLTLIKWVQNGVGGRLKAVHIINHPTTIDYLYKVTKPLMKEKLKKRIIFHGSTESLLDHVGANNLPTFIGGSLDPDKCIDKNLVHGFFHSDQYFQDMLEVGFPIK